MSLLVTPVFVGRNEEIAQFEGILTDVQEGAGRCVMITGEAGIGKSRLLSEVRARALDMGFITLLGRCFDQDRSLPYAPLIDMLRAFFAQGEPGDLLEGLGRQAYPLIKLLPELAVLVPSLPASVMDESIGEERLLFEALTGLFQRLAEAAPVLITLEDLHWSDRASLEYLLYFVRRMGSYPILLLLSRRDLNPQPGLTELLTGLDREPIAQERKLDPLTRLEVTALIKAILDQPEDPSDEFVQAIYSLTEGNPLFAEEICTSLIASGDLYPIDNRWRRKPMSQLDIPDSLQRLVQQRLVRLGKPARRLIDLAAISGRSFDLSVLQTITGHSEVELMALVKELIAAQLVVEGTAEQFSFRHALTREALYSRLLGVERRALHRQLVEAIQTVHAGSLEGRLEALAYHAFEAGMWRQALDYDLRAGQKALALYAPHTAIEHFNRAIQAAGQASQAPPIRLYQLRAQAYDILGDFEPARMDYERALEAAQAAGDLPDAWRMMLDLGLLWASRDYERTGEYCQEALALAREMEDQAAIGHSFNRLGNWLMNSGRLQEALETHRQALELFEGLQDRPGIAETLDLLAMTSNQCGDAVGTVAYYQRAIPILRDLNDRQTLASSLTMLSLYTLDEGMAREAIQLSQEIGWRAGEAYAWEYLGMLLFFRGDLGGGLAAARQGLEMARDIDHRLWQAWGHIVLGMIYLELLAPEQASQHLETGRETALEVGSTFMVTLATGLLASSSISLGRLAEAEALLPEKHPQSLIDIGYSLLKASAELRLARNEADEALTLLPSLEVDERDKWPGGMAYFIGEALRLRSETLIRLKRLPEARADLQSALDLYRRQRVGIGMWRIKLALGKLYQAQGDLQQAEAAFSEARNRVFELAAGIDDEPLRECFLNRANDMVPHGRELTPRQKAKQQFGGLTRRERQVAAIVAQGLSNQEIADELVISVKTVEAHVTHILTKLGFTSRTQIAAWAVDKGLASAPQDLGSLTTES